jgi:hypothetical protein
MGNYVSSLIWKNAAQNEFDKGKLYSIITNKSNHFVIRLAFLALTYFN